MQNHPDHDIYEIMHQRARHHDPCSITDIPTYCFTNGNILMGRVKIYLPYHIDTRVEDVNLLRRDATNKAIAWKLPDCELEHYFSKTAWRGMNETGNYKQQKKAMWKLGLWMGNLLELTIFTIIKLKIIFPFALLTTYTTHPL